ncbi:MAG: protein-L-isoaspartate(D-aspartate) O-methyltransferase [Candidatus Omnitrophica bacterium]|nr:protein-L-isoaspartate(D-aspartate) O-methyltransferase [Candidatus Omnitrophota bacterium]
MSEIAAVGVLAVLLLVGWTYYAYSRVTEESLERSRTRMVNTQIKRRGITDQRILDAMLKVERHRFVPKEMIQYAYEDHPLPIGNDQTISQPYIVAIMTYLLKPKETDVVLEIGTGSGYQAAVLAEIVKDVYTIEIVEPLGKRAIKLLKELNYDNIHVRIGDGYRGWPDKAPFDKIIVTAAPDHVPQALVDQLKVGGRMVIPVGESHQELLLITKDKDGIKKKEILPVRFVPMTGEADKE